METLVFDTSGLLNFGHRGELEFLLPKLRSVFHLVVPVGVRGELVDADRKEYYERLLHEHFSVETVVATRLKLVDLRRLSGILGNGEINVILLCQQINGVAVLDDKQARHAARSLGVRVMGTFGVLEKVCQLGFCTDEECLGFVAKLVKNRFRAPALSGARTFGEYLKTLGDG